jgi:hypothetical protein
VDHCDECGFVYDEESTGPLDGPLLSTAGAGATVLRGQPAEVLRHRPRADVWSPLEYGCHVRDVLLAQRERVFTALVEDNPAFAPMYRDRRAVLARYNDQDPHQVADELELAAGLFARQLALLTDEQLVRRCLYLFPTPAMRTVRWVGLHTLHECQHHLRDIERALPDGTGRAASLGR